MINDYIKNIIENRQNFLRFANQQELVRFIVEVYKLYKNREPNSQELSVLIQSFETGIFSAQKTIDKIVENKSKFNFELQTLYDKNGNPIKRFVK